MSPVTGNPQSAVLSERGWGELAKAQWAPARESFAAALKLEQTPEALEGLSWAAWWLDAADLVFDARERAFRLYQKRGHLASAARMAIWLAADQLDFYGAFAIANGWLRRARRLLDQLEPGPDHGWLAFHEGYIALAQADSARSLELALRTAELGRRCHVLDLQMLGLALQGATLVSCADVAEGMACLDEAAAMALAGEVTIPISGAWACCFLVSACEAVRDYSRAFEWCDRIAEFSQRYGSRYMLGFCREHYGAVHVWRGQWAKAEAELEGAIEAYSRARPAFVAGPRAGLAELRRRQGDWDRAEQLLNEAGVGSVLLCRARLALDRGDARLAIELTERWLRRVPQPAKLQRASALELLIRARAARGEFEQAGAALDELQDVAQLIGTFPLRAAVDLSRGILEAASGNHEAARRLLEDAVDHFERAGAPFEAAQARIELATSLLALSRPEEAAREARSSLDALTRLGAAAEMRRARKVLDLSTGEPAAASPMNTLTRREREVLRWVAAGLTNRQIAERLVVSEHTVHRHITNLLRKLNLPSRTAAAAHAVQAGLLDSEE